MVKSGQAWSGTIVTLDGTGALAAASVGPAGVLYVDGAANGATVTITGSNPYKWAVTLPTLTAGQSVSMYITATVGGIATGGVVAEDQADTKRTSDLNDAAAAPSAASNASAVRTELAVELAHLDADVSAGAHPGDAMTLADDAITSAKYDQTTAHPLAQADTGNTAVARTGADGDTLETLSDQIDSMEAGTGLTAQETADAVHNLTPAGTPAAGSIGAHLDTLIATTNAIKTITDDLDVTDVTQVAASSAGHLMITAGLTFDEAVTGLTIPADWVTALWTLKNNARDTDTAALVQLRATNPAAGGDGLQRLNGAAVVTPITAADGELTVTQASGRIDVWLSDEMTAMLDATTAIGWDVKFIDAAGDSFGRRGTADVVLTETKATA